MLAEPAEWAVDPWSGELRDGEVWGRGALDMKSQVAANAVAIGSGTHPATFRQKRDGVDEYIDGQADALSAWEPNVLDDDLAFVVVDQAGFRARSSPPDPRPRSMGRA